MKTRSRLAAFAVGGCISTMLALSGSAAAIIPNFSDCPRSNPDFVACLDVQSTSGSMDIKGFTVPIGTSFELRGAIIADPAEPSGTRFIPPTGKTGIFAKPIQVPGGLLGIDFPIPGNAVTATVKLAGPTSGIKVDPGTLTVVTPVKLALTNPIIGPGCQIGSDSSPIRLVLIVGTTAPPPPNGPISGRVGTFDYSNPSYIGIIGNTNVNNSFAIPGASGCGIGLGLINALVNTKLKLPSAAGNNTLIVDNDVFLAG
jgi:hypothetical protein